MIHNNMIYNTKESSLPGSVFLSGIKSLERKIDSFISAEEGDLTLDMKGQDYIDSMTLASLIKCASRLFVKERSVRLINCNDSIKKCIELAGLEDFLKIS